MIKLKTEKDIVYIERAISIGEYVLQYIKNFIVPRITTLQLNAQIEYIIKSLTGIPSFKGYKGFPYASCISVNEEIIHGLPSERKLKNGDIVKIDIGVNYKGYYSDQARTYVVGFFSCLDHKTLFRATNCALNSAILESYAGNSLKNIGKVIEDMAKRYGLGILKDYYGHGVGFAVHEDPIVANKEKLNKDITLKKGMVLAIEPLFVLGNGNYTIDKNGWTVIANGISSHFEKTVIVR